MNILSIVMWFKHIIYQFVDNVLSFFTNVSTNLDVDFVIPFLSSDID